MIIVWWSSSRRSRHGVLPLLLFGQLNFGPINQDWHLNPRAAIGNVVKPR
jgi:hypothetical protein